MNKRSKPHNPHVRQKSAKKKSTKAKPDYYKHPDKLQRLRVHTQNQLRKLRTEVEELEYKMAIIAVLEKDLEGKSSDPTLGADSVPSPSDSDDGSGNPKENL